MSPWDVPLDICFSDKGILISVAMFWGHWPHREIFPPSLVLSSNLLLFLSFFPPTPPSLNYFLLLHGSFMDFENRDCVPLEGRGHIPATTFHLEPLLQPTCAFTSPSILQYFLETLVPKLPSLNLTSGKPCWFKFFWNFYTSLHTFQIITKKYLGKNEKWTVLKSLL